MEEGGEGRGGECVYVCVSVRACWGRDPEGGCGWVGVGEDCLQQVCVCIGVGGSRAEIREESKRELEGRLPVGS